MDCYFLFVFFFFESLCNPIVEDVGNYRYQIFLQSGEFIIPNTMIGKEAEIFIVAGGGCGNDGYQPDWWGCGGGGGGAGGVIFMRTILNQTLYNVVIGNGGITKGSNGENSVFGSFVAFGGGGGGRLANGQQGGSGGGAGKYDKKQNTGGISLNQQGKKGGDAPYINHGGSGAGGGGYSEAGGGTSGNQYDTIRPGYGGNGINMTDWLLGLPYGDMNNGWRFFAGGGAGGAATNDYMLPGGRGGGGNGYGTRKSYDGSPNTGGGGGGTRLGEYGKGGSGIVIVKYVKNYSETIQISPKLTKFVLFVWIFLGSELSL